MTRPENVADVCVLLTPREIGGHEVALFGWLADAVRLGLRPAIVAPTAALVEACRAAGLGHCLWPAGAEAAASGQRILGMLKLLWHWRRTQRPLLLVPGVLHANAWLLALALLMRLKVWVYVPTTYTAVRLGYSAAIWRDRLLAPWLRRVRAWITINAQHTRQLRQVWQVHATVHMLPNQARISGEPLAWPEPAADGRLRVSFVGRFELWGKGLDWLAQAISSHPDWCQRFRWSFQGRGPGELALLELASALGPQHVVVRPFAPLDVALAASDVIVLSSRYEGVPLVALEATARGWPVVACRGIGLDALLPPGSLFEFGDAMGLASALDSLQSSAKRSEAAAHSRSQLASTLSRQAYEEALAHLVEALQGRRPGLKPC
jgi:glycosyltransferase involved in cell wall biosynthesis